MTARMQLATRLARASQTQTPSIEKSAPGAWSRVQVRGDKSRDRLALPKPKDATAAEALDCQDHSRRQRRRGGRERVRKKGRERDRSTLAPGAGARGFRRPRHGATRRALSLFLSLVLSFGLHALEYLPPNRDASRDPVLSFDERRDAGSPQESLIRGEVPRKRRRAHGGGGRTRKKGEGGNLRARTRLCEHEANDENDA